MNKLERRNLERALELITQGAYQEAVSIFKTLLRIKSHPTLTPIVKSFSSQPRQSGTAVPKKKRIVSRKTIERYKREHPLCEVCEKTPMADPHHLLSVGLGGSDIEQNLLRLCWNHHIGPNGWHTIGMYKWFDAFQMYLSYEALKKVEARLLKGCDEESDTV